MQFFVRLCHIHTPLLVATSVNSAMKICLACSWRIQCPKNCFTTDYFDNFFSTKDFNSKKTWLKCFVLHWMTIFFFSFFINHCMHYSVAYLRFEITGAKKIISVSYTPFPLNRYWKTIHFFATKSPNQTIFLQEH